MGSTSWVAAGGSGALTLVLDGQGKASVIRFLQQQVRQFAFRPIFPQLPDISEYAVCTPTVYFSYPHSLIPTPLFALTIDLFFKRS